MLSGALKPDIRVECNVHRITFVLYDVVNNALGAVMFSKMRFEMPRADDTLRAAHLNASREALSNFFSSSIKKDSFARLSPFKACVLQNDIEPLPPKGNKQKVSPNPPSSGGKKPAPKKTKGPPKAVVEAARKQPPLPKRHPPVCLLLNWLS